MRKRTKAVGVLVATAALIVSIVGVGSAAPPPTPVAPVSTGTWVMTMTPGKVPTVATTLPAIRPMDVEGSDQPVWHNNKTVWSATCAGENPVQRYSRFSVCVGVVGWGFTHYTRKGSALIADGGIAGVLTSYATIPHLRTAWTHVIQMKPMVIWGVAAQGRNYISAQASCNTGCREQYGRSQVPLRMNVWNVLTVGVASNSLAVGAIRHARYSIDEVFDHVGTAEGAAISQGTLLPDIRCDNGVAQSKSSGCVFDGAWPAVEYSRHSAAQGQVAIHIAAAQATIEGHPGRITAWMPSGTALHRTQSAAQIAANSRKKTATCKTLPKPPSWPSVDCDEYPFASSREGAGSGGIYSVKYVLRGQNRSAGTTAKNVYNLARVINGDAFYVAIV